MRGSHSSAPSNALVLIITLLRPTILPSLHHSLTCVGSWRHARDTEMINKQPLGLTLLKVLWRRQIWKTQIHLSRVRYHLLSRGSHIGSWLALRSWSHTHGFNFGSCQPCENLDRRRQFSKGSVFPLEHGNNNSCASPSWLS